MKTELNAGYEKNALKDAMWDIGRTQNIHFPSFGYSAISLDNILIEKLSIKIGILAIKK